MIGDLKPHPEMRNSGVPWLGAVPSHWQVLPARAVYKAAQVKNVGLPETRVLSLSFGRIVVKPEEKLHGLVPESFENYQIVIPGDIVVRTTDLQNDRTSLRVGHSNYRGIITSAYMCLKTPGFASNGYGYQVLNAYDLLKVIYAYGSGLRQNLDFHHIKPMPVPVPPPDEQVGIVRFLRYADEWIWRAIKAKQKMIALLNEERGAVIQRFVTRGLDPSVACKPSGIDWLSQVPAHWQTMRLKVVVTDIVDCLHATPVYSDQGLYPAIRTSDLLPGRVLLDTARRVDEEHYRKWTGRLVPRAGDILYTREGERFGIAALVPAGAELCISQRMMIFRVHERHNAAFVMWQINCSHVYSQAAADVIGAAAPHVNIARIRNFWLVLPPREEQDAIVEIIDRECARPDEAIARARSEMALLREFRVRLVADVVTGKLDVRAAAADLPDEVEQLEIVGATGAEEFVEAEETESDASEDAAA